jgi:uncharacterized protein DUF4112
MTSPTEERDRVESALARVNRLAYWLDEAFEIPVIGTRIGLDPLIGLVPGAGDWATAALSVYIFAEALRLAAPVRLLARMTLNIVLDLLVGLIPLLGDLADVAVKANRRNADLLLAHCGAETHGGHIRFARDPLARERSTALGRWTAALLLVTVIFALAAAPIYLLAWLLRSLAG